jgi:hypothetical protein
MFVTLDTAPVGSVVSSTDFFQRGQKFSPDMTNGDRRSLSPGHVSGLFWE